MQPLPVPLVVEMLRTSVTRPRPPVRRGVLVRPRSVRGWVVRREPSSAGLIRRALQETLAGWGVAEAAAYDVVLVSSELVGNAVEHTTGAWVRVVVCGYPGAVALSVLDQGPAPIGRLCARHDCDEALRGRGLRIVEEIAAWWGSRRVGSGTLVRALLAVPADPDAGSAVVESPHPPAPPTGARRRARGRRADHLHSFVGRRSPSPAGSPDPPADIIDGA